MAIFLLAAFAILAVADWFAVARGHRRLEWVAKPGAVVALLVWAAVAEQVSPLLLIALACSLAGDVLLMLPRKRFIAGLFAFLLAHLAYVGCFRVPLGSRMFAWVVVLLTTAPVAIVLLRAIKDSRLRIAVATYVGAIGLMVASAVTSGNPTAAGGAFLFMTSDLVIGWNRFVERLPHAEPMIMVTYHLGQLGLVSALRGP